MFILWLGERITDKGIGNGISLIIMIGIIARLPQSLFQELISRMTDKTGGLVMFLIELVVLLVVIAFAILWCRELERFLYNMRRRSWVTSNMAVLDSIFL